MPKQINDRRTQLNRLQWIKMICFIGLLAVGLISLVTIDNLLASFIIAVVISYFVTPIVSHIEGTGLNRISSIVLVYCFFTAATIITISAVMPFLIAQFASLKERLPDYVEKTVELYNNFQSTLDINSAGFFKLDIEDKLRNWLTTQSSILVDGLPQVISSSFSVLVLSPLIGFFLLKDGHLFARELLKLVPNNIFELILSLQSQISAQIGYYIRARMLESIIVGGVCLLGFWIIGFPYAFLLAVFAGVANLIPYVGPLFGAAPGVVLALIIQSSEVTLILVFTIYAVAQIIDNLFIIPLVVARIVNLHPLTVIFSVLLGAQLMGILGMLISIPVASTLKVTFQSVYNHLIDQTG